LTNQISANPPSNVVFDLGGVMAEISHTWEDAALCAGVTCSNLRSHSTKLTALDAFEPYQAGQISLDEYLGRLAEFAGCSPEDALRVHNGILVEEYPGIRQLVDDLHQKGVRTGCLSNTNPPHWDVLALNGQYPAIHSLEMKMASHLAGVNKPSPEIFELYTTTFGIEPNSIAFFDDYQANVDGALACGWQARWIDASKDTPTQLREHLVALGVI